LQLFDTVKPARKFHGVRVLKLKQAVSRIDRHAERRLDVGCDADYAPMTEESKCKKSDRARQRLSLLSYRPVMNRYPERLGKIQGELSLLMSPGLTFLSVWSGRVFRR
jgi:hypothetical protein